MPLDYAGKTLRGRPFQLGENLRKANFSGANLRGVNFKGLDLSGANFSHADIRGANFSNATLIGANFTKAKAGMQRHWATVLVIFSLLLSLIAGLCSVLAGSFVILLLNPYDVYLYTIIPGLMVLIMLAVFFIVTIRQGLGVGAVVMAVEMVAALPVVGAVLDAVVSKVEDDLLAPGAAAAGTMVVSVASAAVGSVVGALVGAVALAVAIAVAGGRAGSVVLVVSATPAVAMVVSVAVAPAVTLAVAVGWVGAVAVALALVVLSIYIARRALAGDEKHAFIRKIALFFSAMGGTNFYNANLTDANFTQATLKCTKFTGANLTRTRFYEAKKLHLARVGKSILDNLAIRTLLVTGNGRQKSYFGANLRGANLIGADLSYANFKEADITDATFQEANLEWANLSLTKAIGADFTSAQMTGACIEAWNIESNTKLDNIGCRFVYLLEQPKPGTDNRERRPSSGEFAPGEFTKLF